MFSNLSFGVLSIIYIVFLMWAFFRKVHIESLELKIFKNLLITNFIGLMMEFILNLSVMFFPDTIITIILAKVFLIFFIVFSMFILGYVIVISKGENFYIEHSKCLKKFKVVVCIISSIITFCLPIYVENGINPYSHGPAVNWIYLYSTIIILSCIYLLIKNRELVKKS